jgi:hypothetical protein
MCRVRHGRELQDKKDEETEALNPLEDPIFYVILTVASPVVVLFVAAQVCLRCKALRVFACGWEVGTAATGAPGRCRIA